MTHYLVKLLVSAGIIVTVSEVAKFNPALGALIKSLPLVSLLAIIWLYMDTHDGSRIAALSTSTFWLVLPTVADVSRSPRPPQGRACRLPSIWALRSRS